MRNPSIYIPFSSWSTLDTTIGLPSNAPYANTLDPGNKLEIKISEISPPPNASNKQSNLYFSKRSLYYFSHPLLLVTKTYWAPSDISIYFCCSLCTILRRGICYFLHILITIRPNAEAAAVLIIPCLQPVALNLSTKPSAVSGLINPQAALGRGTSY